MKDFYYSIVVTSRNDDHGGNMTERMILFVNGLLHQSRKYALPIELIFVEWNPPKDRPYLSEILPQPQKGDFLEIRFIRVPELVHKLSSRADLIPVPQFVAKNVGIRRARGKFVLATNVDLLFSDALMEILAKKQLQEDTFYRANRVDVENDLNPEWDFDAQIAFCEKHVIRILGWDNRFKSLNVEELGLQSSSYFTKVLLNFAAKIGTKFSKRGRREFFYLDKMACGDFTMMSRKAWENIDGYMELDLFPAHIDTLGLVMAKAKGMTQVTFPRKACVYHLEHEEGWINTTAVDKMKAFEKRPSLGYDIVWGLAVESLEMDVELKNTTPDWGYRQHEFEEITLTAP